MKILILCTGNSCRSQMAHGFLQSFDKNIIVCSAGTEASGKLNEKAVRVMKEIGIEKWDYVITVCGEANEVCPVFTGRVKKRLNIGFDDPSHAVGSEKFVMSEFYRVRDEIKNAFRKFYDENIKGKYD